jgi:outer membrane lipoprotein-sorting protein
MGAIGRSRGRPGWEATAVAVAFLAGVGAHAAEAPKLSAAQIVERNVAARGGLAAWRDVRTLALSGRMDIGGKSSMEVPFRSEMKRPRKLRFELEFQGKRAVQVYDGAHGWKLRPFLGLDQAEPYSPQEQQQAAELQELDGPLIDYKAKGTRVALEGVEAIEGHDAYKLKLTFKDGTVRHDWIDAKSFLEVRVEGAPRRLDGRMHDVQIYYRDYRAVQGLMMPFVLETAVQGVVGTRKMTVEKVEINPKIDDAAFLKPQAVAAAAPSHAVPAAAVTSVR